MKYPTPSYENDLREFNDLFDNFIMDRVTGKSSSYAAWIRNFVLSHPDYKQDSVISEVILIKIENQL